jgi:hypothetical protein
MAEQNMCTNAAKVHEARWEALARAVMDYSRGTLWWVDETLWKEILFAYDRQSDRQGHPGLSIRNRPIQGLFDQIPMLHGCSKGGGVKVTGLDKRSPDRTTHFGPLVGPVPVAETVPLGGAARVQSNRHKPRLTDWEAQRLEAYLQGMRARR